MKLLLGTAILISLLYSCSKELHTTKQVVKNSDKIYALSKKLFSRFDEQTFLVPKDLDSLGLDKSEINFLMNKLKCPYVQLIYSDKEPYFFQADSVVLFTRTGLPILGKENNVVVDMKQAKRDSIPVGRKYIKYYKVTDRIYYIQEYMPAF